MPPRPKFVYYEIPFTRKFNERSTKGMRQKKISTSKKAQLNRLYQSIVSKPTRHKEVSFI